ncbi:YfiT family bacillithiol transferase [Alicyclobacillus fastidiosus]|uniref:Putative metal-dependent hydrolase KKP3000_000625 n=1 Tax=Alicyclobacillus fastidiosus TaxID=392011 RepID=A0ABV5AHU1_9BACL|nr:bacillithiol transferase BstA [Alicyclobacillus fastidiosus]WEH11588.1 bacillithiol transferase BstA [Alicyclobacillus fastidiosus]
MRDFQYPIGKFERMGKVSAEQRVEWIEQIAETPTKLRSAISGLSGEKLDTPYRPGGWTVRQVVHHLPDSHMNSYIRFKLALTEENPIIKPYMENLWAELTDYQNTPIEVSLILLESLHGRWVTLLSNLEDTQFSLTFTNPESGEILSLETALGLYAWHGRHHIAQITSLRERMGW